jgi:hypothetical protein
MSDARLLWTFDVSGRRRPRRCAALATVLRTKIRSLPAPGLPRRLGELLHKLDDHPQRVRRLINLLRGKAQDVTGSSERNLRTRARREQFLESRIALRSLVV